VTQTDVVVVGAGPTGLTLACDLARRGVAVRIVDRAQEFAGGSRGKGLSPRSLEVLDDLAVIDRVLASGITHLPHRKYQGAEVIAEVDPEAGLVRTPDIPYPTGLMIPQWRVEQILRDSLSLLYRASLSSAVHRFGVTLGVHHTEREVLKAVKVALDDARARYFADLVAAWQRVVYAGEAVSPESVLPLCAGFSTHFDRQPP